MQRIIKIFILFLLPFFIGNVPFIYAVSPSSDTLRLSPDAIKSKIHYTATDSMRFEMENKTIYLFGNAEVTYENLKLKGAYIILDMQNNMVYAEGRKDSTGKFVDNPEFTENGQTYKMKTIKYNFKNKKGQIKNVITEEEGGYIHGETIKKDSSNTYYIKNGKYTTCDLEHPHFYIAASKLKVIPNDKIITGPAYLVIEDVPTPLFVPFGFFPNTKGRHSGIILPTYRDNDLGFGLVEGGYYLGINDYFDLALKGDIYSRGSWAVRALSYYTKRYKYSGSFNLNYANTINGQKEFPQYSITKDYKLNWQHNQDPKANPNSKFSANVNIVSAQYNKYHTSNVNDYLNNTFSSSINYNKTWPGTPFNLQSNLGYTQNSITRNVTIQAPQAVFSVNRLYPFRKKLQIGETKWYEKIYVTSTTNLVNEISTTDTLLFKSNTLNSMRSGIKHNIPVSLSLKFFKYINLAPSFNYNEYWYLQSVNKTWNAETKKLEIDTLRGFQAVRDYNTGVNLNTTPFYGMYQFRKGIVKAIRHTATPGIGFLYSPGIGNKKEVIMDTTGAIQKYSPFEIAPSGIGYPSTQESGNLSFNLKNTLEMKVKSARDTTSGTKKISLLDNLSIGSTYDLLADSLNWSKIAINASTNLFQKFSLSMDANFDPYIIDPLSKQRRNKFEWNENKRVGRLTNFTLTSGFSLRGKDKNSQKNSDETQNKENTNADDYVYFNIPWSLRVDYSFNYNPDFEPKTTQSVRFSGEVSPTPNWKIVFSSGYDFTNDKLSLTQFDIYRDLHCWEMHLNLTPFGELKHYDFTINVKSHVLQDLKLTRRRDWYNLK